MNCTWIDAVLYEVLRVRHLLQTEVHNLFDRVPQFISPGSFNSLDRVPLIIRHGSINH